LTEADEDVEAEPEPEATPDPLEADAPFLCFL